MLKSPFVVLLDILGEWLPDACSPVYDARHMHQMVTAEIVCCCFLAYAFLCLILGESFKMLWNCYFGLVLINLIFTFAF